MQNLIWQHFLSYLFSISSIHGWIYPQTALCKVFWKSEPFLQNYGLYIFNQYRSRILFESCYSISRHSDLFLATKKWYEENVSSCLFVWNVLKTKLVLFKKNQLFTVIFRSLIKQVLLRRLSLRGLVIWEVYRIAMIKDQFGKNSITVWSLPEKYFFLKKRRCLCSIKVSVDLSYLGNYLRRSIDAFCPMQRIFEGKNGKKCINLSFDLIGTFKFLQIDGPNFFYHCHFQQPFYVTHL